MSGRSQVLPQAATTRVTAWSEPRRYPIPGPASIVECPVHLLSVALDETGRVSSPCPGCRREADRGIRRLRRRR